MPHDKFNDLHSYEGDALTRAGFKDIPQSMDPVERSAFERRWAQKDFKIVDGIIVETLPEGVAQEIRTVMDEAILAEDPTVTRLARILRRSHPS